jgi:glutaredoxin
MNQHPTKGPERSALPTLKTVVTLALIACIGYGGWHYFSGVTITRGTPGNVDTASPITAPDKTVLLYSSTGCKYCKMAKEFLTAHNIPFEEIDVYNIDRGKEDFARLGRVGVPIMIVADTKIIGFDEGELKSVLKSKGMWQ